MASGLENLKIYQLAKKLEKFIYLITNYFPTDEKFAKISQMRRSSASVADNIAESYGKFSFKAKINSLYIARGEAYEIRHQIDSVTEKYIDIKLSEWLADQYTQEIKCINGFIRYLKSKSN